MMLKKGVSLHNFTFELLSFFGGGGVACYALSLAAGDEKHKTYTALCKNEITFFAYNPHICQADYFV